VIKAILFDLDGTIHDSRDAILFCIIKTFQDYSLIPPSQESITALLHLGAESLFEHFAPKNMSQNMLDHFRKIYKDQYSRIMPYKNAKKVLCQLHEQKYILGIVSSTRAAEEFITSYEMNDLFDIIVGGGATTKHKPDPEPVLFALQKLHIPAEQAAIVGDMPADIEAGHAAQLKASIAILHGHGTRQLLERSKPDYFVNGFEELRDLLTSLNT
jgi:HAD superfamily hydrolase (TIGR01509 family)